MIASIVTVAERRDLRLLCFSPFPGGKRAEPLENDAQANGSPVRCCGVDLRSDDWRWSI